MFKPSKTLAKRAIDALNQTAKARPLARAVGSQTTLGLLSTTAVEERPVQLFPSSDELPKAGAPSPAQASAAIGERIESVLRVLSRERALVVEHLLLGRLVAADAGMRRGQGDEPRRCSVISLGVCLKMLGAFHSGNVALSSLTRVNPATLGDGAGSQPQSAWIPRSRRPPRVPPLSPAVTEGPHHDHRGTSRAVVSRPVGELEGRAVGEVRSSA